jgi:hypothetical protein
MNLPRVTETGHQASSSENSQNFQNLSLDNIVDSDIEEDAD